MTKQRKLLQSSLVCWAYSNYGCLWGVARTRGDAIRAIEKELREPWRTAKSRMEVWKCRVSKRA
jgi:hypothetical protein